jgi:Tol biopolymer transport system component
MDAPPRSFARWLTRAAVALTLGAACAGPAGPAAGPQPAAPVGAPPRGHLANVRQLTFGGENAEAYWSFDGSQLVFQARSADQGCDRIYKMDVRQDRPAPVPVSSGQGATTCSYFLPADREVVFSSTHLAGATCPPRPDHSKGYVWPLYPSYDIFRANADGSNLRRLTEAPGYDAEATVCAKDGSIVFTSVRDGDLELYRMNADGTGVKRLTQTAGYDGGAFFSPDCSKIVWRASRPRPGPELDDYQALLKQNLVRPSKLEIWIADADGTDARQITYLGAASFAPSFFPSGRRIIFSSNIPDAKREFDLWAVDVDGGNLERITTEPGFDGFPMFSPDGKRLAFASNRATPPGSHDTNVFVADWVEAPPVAWKVAPLAADRIAADIGWLADPKRQGRGVGTEGLAAAGAYVEEQMKAAGLEPAGDGGTFRQSFPVTVKVSVSEANTSLDGVTVGGADVRPLGFSASGSVRGPLVLADYGVVDDAHKIDDYKGVKAKDAIVVVRRFVPEGPAFETPEAQRVHGDLRKKAWLARERGAKALLVVDAPRKAPASPSPNPSPSPPPDEAPFSSLRPEGFGDVGIPVLFVKRAAFAPALAKLEAKKPVAAAVTVRLTTITAPAFNVVGRLAARVPAEQRLPGVIVVGAHYDHLGMGGRHSLAPDRDEPHVGADDNASGTATVLEIARQLARRQDGLPRDVLFVGFSGEEEGVLGSTHFTRTPPGNLKIEDVVAMVNLDMVGRMRGNHVDVFGAKSAKEWTALIDAACEAGNVRCTASGSGDGLGPGDQMPFYNAGVPVVHFFTGTHPDYHKPSDVPAAINAAGAAAVGATAARLTALLAAQPQRLTFQRTSVPTPEGDMRSFNASLGTIPDYAGPPNGAKGVLLAGVRAGGAAEKGGLRRGDVLIRIGRHQIDNVQDLSFVLNASKPHETVTVVVIRDGREVPLPVTFQEGRRR